MSQVVHAIAPGASLIFRTGALSEADFASAIEALAATPYNAQIIEDDLGYFDEPFFQDGILAQAIDTVEGQGVAYFSAAGNDQDTPSYMNTSPSFKTLSTAAPNSGEYLLNFDASGATTVTSLPVTIPPLSPGDFVAVVVEWDQPYLTGCTGSAAQCTGATSQIDVCLTGSTGTDVLLNNENTVTSCSGPNDVGKDPYQVMLIANPAVGSNNTAQQNINIQIGLAGGTKPPGRILVAVEDDGQGSTINAFLPNGPTLQGHPGAAGAAAVGAAFYFDTPRCGTTPATLEPYSSAGGAPILFDTTGAPQTPVVRQKPDFVAPDGVNDTFLGFTLASDYPTYPKDGLLPTTITECQNKPSYPNFFGTSAATPHAAAIAALMLQANPSASPTQIYNALRQSASPMGSSTPNYSSGYGFIQADAALALIPPGAPALTLSASSVVAGKPVTITWSSIAATACTASGDWSGALKASGSQTLTPSAAGTDTYTLTCANKGGNSVASTATLTVTTAGAVPAAPTLTLGAASIAAGTSTTITWSSSNATSCTASASSASAGSWTGPQKTSGTQTLTPTSAGTYTYSLTCSNASGTSKPTAATLTVTAASAPAAPSMNLATTSLVVGSSTTITWVSNNATSCTASGSWSGTLPTSGTQTLTPTSVGTYTFSLTCANAGGNSKPTAETLTVSGVSAGGGSGGSSGGGGALSAFSLLGLAGLVAGRWVRSSRR
jgi:hypothetical protein